LSPPRFLLFALSAILGTLTLYGVNGLITYHMAKTFHSPETVIGTYGTIRGIGAVVGSLLAFFLLDRIGRRAATYGGLCFVSIFAVAIGLAPNPNVIMALGLFW